jgi:subtilisin family serine protease
MTGSLAERLEGGGGPFVVIAHSQGSMVAYEVLRHLTKQQCDVRLLVTIGSPLGLEEVQDVFKQWVGKSPLPVPACVDRWVNVADRLDPVALDSDISNDFAGGIENHRGFGLNPDSPRHPHSGSGYLRTAPVRDAVRQTVGNAFGQAVARAIITKDLVAEIEDGLRDDRHRTLIQLAADGAARAPAGGEPLTLDEMGERLTTAIEKMVVATGQEPEVARIERMRRFIAADLTRQEVERLRTLFADLRIERVWRNMQKRALIHASTHTVQARPANLGYGATGRDIGWAVLDTGIRADHPHFKEHKNVVRQWDCTKRGAPVVSEPGQEEFDELDGNGHGTHVAATIAGYLQVRRGDDGAEVELAGMAPEARLYGFKVLDDRGNGHDSYIIKALDLIAEINEAAGRLVIQGVNVSLGGNFDPSVYGCGHTPLCQEFRRLWRQGVLVCLAAGNEGYAMLQGAEGELPANMDLSIGDPANLEEAIAVGSVHKTNPHTYGVSFFSSRGPTADGRRKPDLVAPGEQILSAYHGWPKGRAEEDLTLDDLYVEMSGTSMATPHVSGILAGFLSARREFIGYPDRVKALLLEHCTDLNRDPYIQGAGLANLIKMLVNC